MKRRNSLMSVGVIGLLAAQSAVAATVPTFTITPPVAVATEEDGFFGVSCNLAANTHKPQILVTSIDLSPADVPNDPLTGEPAQAVLRGFFVDPTTLTVTQSFVIAGNPDAPELRKNDVKYNAATRQFVVATVLRNYRPNGLHLVHIALVNTDAAPGTDPVSRRFIHAPDSEISYDDVAIAVSSQNGNIALAAELSSPPNEGEAAIVALYGGDGTLLTEPIRRVDDFADPTRDEDDPDIIYLANRDVFLFTTNTDVSTGPNRIAGSVIQTVPGPGNTLVVSQPQFLGVNRLEGANEGHSATIENPWNGELISAFDYGNDQANGDLSFYTLGAGPAYSMTEARPQIPYAEGSGKNPFGHRHPQLEPDPSAGVILVGVNISGSEIPIPDGVGFKFLDTDGSFLPGVPEEAGFHFLAETGGPISGDVNSWNVKYDSFSDSFVFGWYVSGVGLSVARLQVTSSHLPEATPALTITRTPTGVEVRWPSPSTGYQLQSRITAAGGAWQPVNAPQETVNSSIVVSLDAGSETSFLRLAKP